MVPKPLVNRIKVVDPLVLRGPKISMPTGNGSAFKVARTAPMPNLGKKSSLNISDSIHHLYHVFFSNI
jgi:cephalosporin hydroxylase